MIDYHELKVALRALGFPAKKDEVLKIVQRYDVDDVGRVSKKQFVAIMTQKYAERDPEDEIRKAFQLFDADGTGRISLKNMQAREQQAPTAHTHPRTPAHTHATHATRATHATHAAHAAHARSTPPPFCRPHAPLGGITHTFSGSSF
jgi:hypothetical protein